MSSIPPVGAAPGAVLLAPDAGLATRLALGQVVRAQVLEHQEGNRYLMRILGQTLVAESAVALRPNDVFHGRVVGLQDRIELERVEPSAVPTAGPGEESIAGLGGGRAAEVIEELFRRYRGTLDPRDAQALERMVARAARPDRMALAGLVLRKLGLPLDPDLLQALVSSLSQPALAPIGDTALELVAAEGDATDALPPGAGQWPPVQRVLNAQGGGAVAHQVGVLPLQFGGRLIAVEVALFEEDDGRAAADPRARLRHRKLVLSLDTEALGRVQARALTAGNHLRIALATESSVSTNALLRYAEPLSRALETAGWQVDEVSHETRARPETNAAVAAAIDHLITPGSVDRVL